MTANRIMDAIVSAELIAKKLLGIKPQEEVVIIGDPETDVQMMNALSGVIQSIGAECTIAIMPTRRTDESTKMTRFIDKGLETADVAIGMTRASGAACYSPVIRTLRDKTGLRHLSMVLRDLDNWTKGGATADYDQMTATAERLKKAWLDGTSIHLTSKKGTDLKAKIGNAPPFIENGFATEPGQEAAFSDGEVSQGPNQGTAEGVVVVDGPMAYIGKPATPIRLEIEKGRVVGVDGDDSAKKQLLHIINDVIDADNFAEIGIGINPNCLQNGTFQEEKKRLGNVHIALGRNTGSYGGTVASMIHMDMVIYDATVRTDKVVLVSEGQLSV